MPAPSRMPLPPRPDVEPVGGANEHEHTYVWLRQETYNEGWETNPTWVLYDLFFCQHCLHIEKVKANPDVAEYSGPAKREPGRW
jgi:hypothetical protein